MDDGIYFYNSTGIDFTATDQMVKYCLTTLAALCCAANLPLAALAGEVMVEGISEDIAINRAKNKVPKGKTITNTSCQEIDVARSTHYRCTVTWH